MINIYQSEDNKFLNLKINQENFSFSKIKIKICISFFKIKFKLTAILEIHQGSSFFCFRFEGLTLQLISCTNSWSLAVQSIFKSTWKVSVTRIPRIRTFSKTLPCRNLKLVFETRYINLQLMPGLLSGGSGHFLMTVNSCTHTTLLPPQSTTQHTTIVSNYGGNSNPY